LGDLLANTSISGRPGAYFVNGYYSDWALHFNVSVDKWYAEDEFDQAYLDAFLKYG
jgi:LPS sulfotransferase NodH